MWRSSPRSPLFNSTCGTTPQSLRYRIYRRVHWFWPSKLGRLRRDGRGAAALRGDWPKVSEKHLHPTVLHCNALHCAAPHCTALHCTALHALHALHRTALHFITLHRTWVGKRRVCSNGGLSCRSRRDNRVFLLFLLLHFAKLPWIYIMPDRDEMAGRSFS